jgi:hypothetical protein
MRMDIKGLPEVLDRFYATSQRYKNQVLGNFEKRNAPRLLPEFLTVKLSPELQYFYRWYHYDALFGSVNIAITPLEELERRQEGFATFSTDQGQTMQPDPAWNEQWTVFADVNDNPIVADAGQAGTPVLAAIEAVDYEVIAPSLADFFLMLTEAMELTASLQEQQPTSDDIEAWITFRTEVEAPATLKRLREVVENRYVQAWGNFLYS